MQRHGRIHRPKPFQVVKIPDLGQHHMHHDAIQVHQGPLTLFHPACADDPIEGGAQGMLAQTQLLLLLFRLESIDLGGIDRNLGLQRVDFIRRHGIAAPQPFCIGQSAPGNCASCHGTEAFIAPGPRNNGLDLNYFRQGSFFTRYGKQRIPTGYNSYGTARSLMEYALRMEQGRLVDEFSSREIKRLLYLTERRIRYASSPALRDCRNAA